MEHSGNPNHRPGPERNLAYLREMAQLRRTEASCDLSEVSYQTEHTDFPNSRHSSINAEPLTLDAEQIHNAKDEAADVLQHADSETVFGVFTKGCLNALNGRVSMMEYFWRQGQDLCVKSDESFSPESPESEILAQQLSALVEKVQEAADGNQQTYVKSPPDALDINLQLEENTPEISLHALEKRLQFEEKMPEISTSDPLETSSQLEEITPEVSAPVTQERNLQLEDKTPEVSGSSSHDRTSADEKVVKQTSENEKTSHPIVSSTQKEFKKEKLSFQI